MNRVGALVSVDLKNHFAPLLVARQVRFGVQRVRVLLITALVAACLAPLFYALVKAITWLYANLHALGQETALVALAVMAGQLLLFVFGFFYVLSAFYFSTDLALLIPLPIRPREVVFSKLVVVMLSQCATVALVALPLFIGYGILAAAAPGYWLMLAPVYLLLPVLPLCVAALCAMALMRVVNLSRRKDAFVVTGALLLITLQLLLQVRLRGGADAGAVVSALTDPDGLLRVFGRSFPPAVWAARSLTQALSPAGWLEFGRLAGASLLAFAGIVVLAEKLFYQGAIGISEVAARRQAASPAELRRGISSGRHPLRAIFLREVRLMNRTPIFLLNGVLVVVIIPVVMLIGMHSPGDDGPTALLMSLGRAHAATMILGLAGFYLVCGCLNGTASSAFSREGRHFWISKVIPVPWKTQVEAKLFHASLVSLLGIVTGAGVTVIALHVPALYLLAALPLAGAGAILLNTIALRIDLIRPRLKWTNPQTAIKQNLNVIVAMAVQFGLVAGAGLLAHALMQARMPGRLVYLLLLFLSAGGAWIAWRELTGFAERRYPQIEE